ncbi:MAG: hypothetical protein AAGJ92_05030 [Pseudomonadota bacterium]
MFRLPVYPSHRRAGALHPIGKARVTRPRRNTTLSLTRTARDVPGHPAHALTPVRRLAPNRLLFEVEAVAISPASDIKDPRP